MWLQRRRKALRCLLYTMVPSKDGLDAMERLPGGSMELEIRPVEL